MRPPVTAQDVALSVAVAPDRHIMLAAGESFMGSVRGNLLLMRYTSTGQLDKSFGHKGIARSAVSAGNNRGRVERVAPNAIAFDAAGDTIVAGADQIRTTDTGTAGPWFLARYSRRGVDCSFGRKGIALGDGRGSAEAVAVQPNGRIVIAGNRGHAFMAARYMGGGTPRTCRDEGR